MSTGADGENGDGSGMDDAGWDPDALGVLLAPFTGTEVPTFLEGPLRAGLGGVILFGHNTPDAATCARLSRDLHAIEPDVLVAVDEEGGDVTRLQDSTGSSLPTAWALGEIDDVGLTRRVGRALGDVLAACDVDLDLAPVLDVSTDPANPVIGTRAYGDEPGLVTRHARAMAGGIRDAGVGVCGKHFPGHGATHVDSHTALPTITLGREQFEREHLEPWHLAPWMDAVMTAHLLVPALGEGPASIASWAREVLDELCGEGGFHGLLITDALDMAAVADTYGYGEAAVRAVEAGAHLLCLGTSIRRDDAEMLREAHDALLAAVDSGRLPRQVLAQRAAEVRQRRGWLRDRRRGLPVPQLPESMEALGRVGAEAATRAVRGRNAEGVLTGGPVMIADARRRRDHASGTRRSLLAGVLAEQGIDAQEIHYPADITRPDASALILTRLPRADPEEQQQLAELLRLRPDAIVVHTGVPDAATPHSRYVLAHGAGRASMAAAAALLLGRTSSNGHYQGRPSR